MEVTQMFNLNKRVKRRVARRRAKQAMPVGVYDRQYTSPYTYTCPFCGSLPIIMPWHGGGPRKRLLLCDDEQCLVRPTVTGTTEARAIAAWNYRA